MFSLLGLSLATGPFIVSILLLQLLSDLFNSFGKISEEIFRSEQLPLLYLANLENQDKTDN